MHLPLARKSAQPDLGGARRARTRPIAALGLIAAVLVGASGCLKVSSDTARLRDAAMRAAAGDDAKWDQKIEIQLGNVSLGLARMIVRHVHDVPPEAHAVLSAARTVEAGVYQLHAAAAALDRAGLIAAASANMAERGWQRAVAVIDDGEAVAVFVPRENPSDDILPVCVVVFDGEQLVVASVRVAPEPLVALIIEQQRRKSAANTNDDRV